MNHSRLVFSLTNESREMKKSAVGNWEKAIHDQIRVPVFFFVISRGSFFYIVSIEQAINPAIHDMRIDDMEVSGAPEAIIIDKCGEGNIKTYAQ